MQFQNNIVATFDGIPSNLGDLQYVINNVNAKYNNSNWKMFTEVLPQSESRKFSVLLDETGIVVKASPLGRMGQKPLRSFDGAALYSDSVHKIGHGFSITQSDLDDIREMNLVNMDLAKEIAKRYANRTQAIIGGIHATFNGWIYNALSKQEIYIYNQGVKEYTFDLRVPAANKLKVKSSNANWFDADPTKYNIINDLMRMVKRAGDDDVNIPKNEMVFVTSKSLKDKILLDPTVITAIKNRMPNINANAILTDNEVETALRVFNLPAIIATDEKSRVEMDGVPTLAPADFDENMISLIPMGKIFNLHNSPSSVRDEKDPSVITTTFEGNLIGALEKFGADPMVTITNFEAIAFPSFKNPRKIVSLDSSQHSANGN